MIAGIFSALVLVGAATGGIAAPQDFRSGFYHHYLENAHYHHLHHHHHDDLDQYKEESSLNVEQEGEEAKRPPPAGLLLITQNPIGLCRTDNSDCSCLKEMSTKRLSECGDSYPFWTVDALWQGTVPRAKTKKPIDIQICNKDSVPDSDATIALKKLSEEERECLTSVWPPLDSDKLGGCGEKDAIIYQGSVQGNCFHDYEKFPDSELDTYYRQVSDLYAQVNGESQSCKMNARACSNRTSIPDTDTADISPPFPQPTYMPAIDEKIHKALMDLGLTDKHWTTIDASALKGKFDKNVYLGCMTSGVGGTGRYVLTRVGFCFRCPSKGPCINPTLVDCWTDAKHPPSTVPWNDRYGDVPCYTGRKKVWYCGYDKLANCPAN